MVEVTKADENAVRDMILRLAACDPASADEVMLNAFAAHRIAALSGVEELVEAVEAFLEGRPTAPPRDMREESIAYKNWRHFDRMRKALSRFRDAWGEAA